MVTTAVIHSILGLINHIENSIKNEENVQQNNISNQNINIVNICGNDFYKKYGFNCPVGVRGRNSDNSLYKEKIGWSVSQPLIDGLKKTYEWINYKVTNNDKKKSITHSEISNVSKA